MRKVVLGFLGLCLSMVLMSCSSLPKVSAGKNIVAGKVITTGVNFDGVYTPFNGKHTDENIVFVKSKSTGKEYSMKCDKEGYFYTTKLPSDEEFIFSRIQLTCQLSNVITWVNGTFSDKVVFKTNDMTITNLGTIDYKFNNGGRSEWRVQYFGFVEADFIDKKTEGTDWANATIVRKNLLANTEEWITR